MRILRRMPVQYAYSFELYDINLDVPCDLKIENKIFINKPHGGIETINASAVNYKTLVKLYPKKDVKLLLYDARFDNKAKNIPVYLGGDMDQSFRQEYTLDEMMDLFGKFYINCIDYKCISLDFVKLQAMGLDGVHVVNNKSPLFESWRNGETIWFNTKWIKSVEKPKRF